MKSNLLSTTGCLRLRDFFFCRQTFEFLGSNDMGLPCALIKTRGLKLDTHIEEDEKMFSIKTIGFESKRDSARHASLIIHEVKRSS